MTVDKASFEQAQNGAELDGTPEEMRAELTKLLGLGQLDGLRVVAAQVFGRGVGASVDLRLSDEQTLTFDRFGDVGKPTALAAHLMSCLGIAHTITAKDALKIGALIHRIAQHHGEASADATAREWGAEFLRFAAHQEFDIEDQADRWRAFSTLTALVPARDAGEDRSAAALASASVVLVDRESGLRLVRCGWFLGYVRREVGGMYSPVQLGTQMERVGWQRQGSEGWIKATSPTDGRTLRWRFYTVSQGWEQQ